MNIGSDGVPLIRYVPGGDILARDYFEFFPVDGFRYVVVTTGLNTSKYCLFAPVYQDLDAEKKGVAPGTWGGTIL